MRKKMMVLTFVLLFVFIGTASAVEVTLLGPKEYLRGKGEPDVYTNTFPGMEGEGKLIIKNGDESGKHRISSAVILVNGQQVLGPDDFNQNIYHIEAPVSLAENNSISVELRSKPGSYLTVQIIQEDPNLSENTKILDVPTTENLISVSSDGSIYTFDESSPQLESLSPGDVIVIGVTESTPYGALRMVTNVEKVGDQVIVETIQATLEDALNDADIEIIKTLSPSDVQTAIPLRKGVSIMNYQSETLATNLFQLGLDAVLFDLDGNHGTTYDQIRTSGNIQFSTDFKFKIKLKNFKLEKLTFTQTISKQANLVVTASGSIPLFEGKFDNSIGTNYPIKH